MKRPAGSAILSNNGCSKYVPQKDAVCVKNDERREDRALVGRSLLGALRLQKGAAAETALNLFWNGLARTLLKFAGGLPTFALCAEAF